MDKLQAKTRSGKPRCQSRISWGSVWVSGRKQCENAAGDDGVLCGVHRNKQAKRHAANQEQPQ